MRPLYRWLIAAAMALVLIGVFLPLYFIGYGLGGMATDSCSNLPGPTLLYLEVLWPIVMLATALVAPVLIVRNQRWRNVWIALATGIVVSACCYLAWFPLIMVICK